MAEVFPHCFITLYSSQRSHFFSQRCYTDDYLTSPQSVPESCAPQGVRCEGDTVFAPFTHFLKSKSSASVATKHTCTSLSLCKTLTMQFVNHVRTGSFGRSKKCTIKCNPGHHLWSQRQHFLEPLTSHFLHTWTSFWTQIHLPPQNGQRVESTPAGHKVNTTWQLYLLQGSVSGLHQTASSRGWFCCVNTRKYLPGLWGFQLNSSSFCKNHFVTN